MGNCSSGYPSNPPPTNTNTTPPPPSQPKVRADTNITVLPADAPPPPRRPLPTGTGRVLGRPMSDIHSAYIFGRELGRGQFGVTHLVTHRATRQTFACKSIATRKLLTPDDVADVRREVQIMHHLTGHRNIVELREVFEDRHNVHLVMELCAGGELFDRIIAKGHYSERAAAGLCRQIVTVVHACHSMGVMHRDLKPENFLFLSADEDSPLKATDFGLSVFFKPGEVFRDLVGSAYYVAPEVLRRNYGAEADIWSAGVILYILLSGVPPFWGENEEGIFDAVLRGHLDFVSDPWPSISSSAKDLVKKMLQSDPKDRLSAIEVLNHPWMREDGDASDKPLDIAVLTRMKQFRAMNKLKKVALKVIAENLSEEEIIGLKEMFKSMDTDNSGTITYEELKAGLPKLGTKLSESEVRQLMEACMPTRRRIWKRDTAGSNTEESTNTDHEEDTNENKDFVMADEHRTMYDYAKPSMDGTSSSIVRPAVAANNFEIKPNVIQMVQQFVQFDGLPDEDPNNHIANFLEICDTFKINGVSDDAVRLRLFPFTLRGRAKQWLNTLPKGTITTWSIMAEKFLLKYFPPAKTARLRNEISSFTQEDDETLYDTWERFKELLRKCPHHGLPIWMQVQTFYNGLLSSTRQMIDAAAGGTLNNKTPEAAQDLIEGMAMNGYQWQSVRGKPNRTVGVYNADAVVTLAAQVEALTQKIDDLAAPKPPPPHVLSCETCGGLHNHQDCPHTIPHAEQANYVGNQGRNYPSNPYSNTYNPGWRQHPNFGWGNQGQPRPNPNPDLHTSPGFQPNQGKPNLEDLITKFVQSTDTRFQVVETSLRNQEASIHNLENQIGQIAKMISERPQGSLPGNTEPNPREHVKAITISFPHEHDYANAAMQKYVEDEKPEEKPMKKVVAEYKPKIPYPCLTEEDRREDKFGKYLKLFKQLHTNISFVRPLSKHARDLNDIISNENKLNELSNVQLNDECSSNELPQKFNDPGSFIIPCTIDGLSVDRALADLGASINVMSYDTFKHMGLSKLKPIRMDIHLADKSIKHPRGIINDVLVKIDKFMFPVDFFILDMHDDIDVPLILGRPFLATAKSIIDVHEGKLTLRVGDEQVIFKIHVEIDKDNTCSFVDSVSLSNVKTKNLLEKTFDQSTGQPMKNNLLRRLISKIETRKIKEHILKLEVGGNATKCPRDFHKSKAPPD